MVCSRMAARGMARVRHGSPGKSRLGWARTGAAVVDSHGQSWIVVKWQSRRGTAGCCGAWQSRQGKAGRGGAKQVSVRQSWKVGDWPCLARWGTAWTGRERQSWNVWAAFGVSRNGSRGLDRLVTSRKGLVWSGVAVRERHAQFGNSMSCLGSPGVYG